MANARIFNAAARPFRALFKADAAEGILLIFVAVAAMIVANSPLSSDYHNLFHAELFDCAVFKLNTCTCGSTMR
jgi:NhaA family Na+:H+ antiporter